MSAIPLIRGYYYSGNLAKVIEEANSYPNDLSVLEYKLRALAELNPSILDAEINDTSPLPLQMIKLMCIYRSANPAQKPDLINVLDEWISTEAVNSSELSHVIAAYVYIDAGKYAEAWRWLATSPLTSETSLEKLALQIHISLLQNCPELCQRILSRMMEIDDDDVLTLLSKAWIQQSTLSASGYHESLSTYLEIAERFGNSELLLNQIGACYVSLGLHTNAFQVLKLARDMAKSNGMHCRPDVLQNTMCVIFQRPNSLSLENELVLSKIQEELLLSEQSNQGLEDTYLQKYQQLSQLFDQTAASFTS